MIKHFYIALSVLYLLTISYSVTAQTVQQVSVNKTNFTSDKEYQIRKLYLEAYNLTQNGCFSQARQLVKDILISYPNDCEYLNLMGIINTGENNLTDAMNCFKKADTLCPDNIEVHINLSKLYMLIGDRFNANIENEKIAKLKAKQ